MFADLDSKFLKKNVREPKNIFHDRAVLDLVDLVIADVTHRQLALNNYIYIKGHHSSLQLTYLAYFHLKPVNDSYLKSLCCP